MTHRAQFPNILPNISTRYCFACHALEPEKIRINERVYYKCLQCKQTLERFLTWDPKMRQTFDDTSRLVHYGAGVFLQKDSGEILLCMRASFPMLLTIPGGHLDTGEDPALCAQREVFEETNLKINDHVCIYDDIVDPDPCPGGADVHHWYLYYATRWDGTLKINDESLDTQWIHPAAIDLATVTPPVRFFLEHPTIQKILKV